MKKEWTHDVARIARIVRVESARLRDNWGEMRSPAMEKGERAYVPNW